MQPAEVVEFSRPVEAERIGPVAAHYAFDAEADERAALAERFGLLSLDRLQTKFILYRLRKDLVRVRGHISASLVQACVVSLEPVAAEIAEDFEVDFVEGKFDESEELDLDADADAPEPLLDGRIDLGEVAAEQLGLAIDPYPRRPDAAVPAEWRAEAGLDPAPVTKVNPFAALEKLKKGKEGA